MYFSTDGFLPSRLIVEYRGNVFQEALNLRNIHHSLNWAGHGMDNARIESLFHSMKAELIRGIRHVSESQLRYDLAEYTNQFYSKKRLYLGI